MLDPILARAVILYLRSGGQKLPTRNSRVSIQHGVRHAVLMDNRSYLEVYRVDGTALSRVAPSKRKGMWYDAPSKYNEEITYEDLESEFSNLHEEIFEEITDEDIDRILSAM